MTNTHITIGGHKITTNKVGQVHTVTSGFGTGFTGELDWIVVNGICYLTTVMSASSATINQNVYSGIPKAKMHAWGICYGNRGGFYVDGGGTTLKGNVLTANATLYATIVYPVADDWVES